MIIITFEITIFVSILGSFVKNWYFVNNCIINNNNNNNKHAFIWRPTRGPLSALQGGYNLKY